MSSSSNHAVSEYWDYKQHPQDIPDALRLHYLIFERNKKTKRVVRGKPEYIDSCIWYPKVVPDGEKVVAEWTAEDNTDSKRFKFISEFMAQLMQGDARIKGIIKSNHQSASRALLFNCKTESDPQWSTVATLDTAMDGAVPGAVSDRKRKTGGSEPRQPAIKHTNARTKGKKKVADEASDDASDEASDEAAGNADATATITVSLGNKGGVSGVRDEMTTNCILARIADEVSSTQETPMLQVAELIKGGSEFRLMFNPNDLSQEQAMEGINCLGKGQAMMKYLAYSMGESETARVEAIMEHHYAVLEARFDLLAV
jgi:hypothetical protein